MYILQIIITISFVNIHHFTLLQFFSCNENFTDVLSQQLSNKQYNIVNYSYPVVRYIPELIYLIIGSLYLVAIFTFSLHLTAPDSDNHQSILYFYKFVFNSLYKGDHTIFLFLCLISCPQVPSMLSQMAGSSSFLNLLFFFNS